MDQISIEIQSNSQSAANGLDTLTASISKLTSILGTGLSSLSVFNSTLKGIKDSLSGFSFDTSGISKMQESFSSLKDMPKVTNLNSTINQLQKIPDINKNLSTSEISTFTSKIKELTNALGPLATEMVKVSSAFSALPSNINKVSSTLNKASNIAKTTNKSLNNNALASLGKGIKFGAIAAGITRITNTLGKFVNSSNEYIENMNLFKVSMGEMAVEAQKFIDNFSGTLGLDPSGLMRYMGLFNNLIEGFGIGSKEAYTMSQSLTQLSYDMSSYLNIPVDEAMQKLKSGISGEIEPMRAVGVALDQATLQETAYTLGIDKKVSAMTRAQKTELLYYQIMQKTKNMQGDLSRTILQPANALRILQQQFTQLARAIGNIFLPILMTIVPYIQVIVQWLTTLAQMIANWLNIKLDFSIPEVDTSGISSGFDDVSDSIGDVGSSADKTSKKLNRMLAQFDELNVIEFDTGTGTGSGSGSGAGSGGSLGIPIKGYDAIGDALKKNLSDVENRLKKILSYVGAIGAGLLAWKVSQKILDFLARLQELKNLGVISTGFKLIGLANFLSDLDEFRKYFEDFLNNGPTFKNVVGMLSEFAGAMGDVFMFMGNMKLGGALKLIQGIGEIAVAIQDIATNGLNWDNATTAIRGLTNIAIAIGAFVGGTKGLMISSAATTIQGITKVVEELAKNWEAIKKGDWSGVDKVSLVIGAIQAFAGIAGAITAFVKMKKLKDSTKAVENIKTVTDVTSQVDSGIGGLSPKLKSLVKNLGLGVAIIAEVSAAAILIVGAIWVLGKELEQVGIAWQPVIDNGQTVATAVGIGTGILIAIGVAVALLGKIGGTKLIAPLGLGTAILAEIGVAAILFVAEIWAIGALLNQIYEAWKPVMDNGGEVATAIGVGTGILVVVGVVAGLLGVATAGTAGLLPLAIGLGTLMLVELGAAALLFLGEIWAIGTLLNQVYEAWKPVMDNGGEVATAVGLGTAILIAIGGVSAALGVASVATIGLLPLAISSGTSMLQQIGEAAVDFISNILTVGGQLSQMKEAWQPVVEDGEPISVAISQGTSYLIKIGEVSAALGVASIATVGLLPLAISLGTSMLQQLETALTDFINSLANIANQLNNNLYPPLMQLNSNLPGLIVGLNNYVTFMEQFADLAVKYSKSSAVSGFAGAINKIIGWFTGDPIKNFANDVNKTYTQTTDLNNKLRLANPELKTAINLMTEYLNFLEKLEQLTGRKNNIQLANSMFVNMKEVGKNLVTGFVEGINSEYSSLANSIENVLKNSLSSWTATRYGESFGEQLGSAISRALKRTNFPKLRATINTSGDQATLKFNAYAEGGLPDVGELFVAREAGPELVGNIGNRAAVANNDQIIQGIAQGTYEAVSRAMQENSNDNQQPIIVKIGERTVYSGYASYANSQSNMYGTNYIKT